MKPKPNKISKAKTGRKKLPLYWILPVCLVVVTFLCYHYSLHNEFTNWDDERLISQNIFIKSFSGGNLKMILLHDVTGDYYFPLTILSYALNYHVAELAPYSYYLTNIVLHLFNCILLFYFTLALFKALEKNGYGKLMRKEWLAFFVALAFAIHPMHVESVSWAAERKDVLYAFFYFLGLITYLRYIKNKGSRMASYLIVLLCFLLSLFSKPMAIVFPFSLLAIDVLLKRDKAVSKKALLVEKIPFLVIAIVSAIVTYILQKEAGAVQEHTVYTFFQRFLFASYGFYMYVLKAFIPYPQSSFYPYPEVDGTTVQIPFIFYISPIIALIVATVPLYLLKRAGENYFRVGLFGIGFYFFNMVIVSQIIGSGPTLMADRYSYVCYFGLFFLLAYVVYKYIEKDMVKRKAVIAISFVYLLLFAFLSYQRTLVWHNSQTLWSDVVKQYPHRIIKAYNNLGNYYFAHGDLDNAYDDYKEAIQLKTADPQVYCNMGSLMGAKKEFKASLFYYREALVLDSNDATTYLDRAITYSAMGRYDLAVNDYRHSFKINPNSEILYRNIAYTYLNAHQFDSSIAYYSHAIQINPDNPGYYHYRGVAEFDKGDPQTAMKDFMRNLQIAPHDSECMFYISIAYNRAGDFVNAAKYAQLAKNAQYDVPEDYVRLLKARLNAQ